MEEAEVIRLAEKALGQSHTLKLCRIARDKISPHVWGLVYEIEGWDGGPVVEVDERTGEATVIPGP